MANLKCRTGDYLLQALRSLISAPTDGCLAANLDNVGAGVIAALCLPVLISTLSQRWKSSTGGFNRKNATAGQLHSDSITVPLTLIVGTALGLATGFLRSWVTGDAIYLVSWIFLTSHGLVTLKMATGSSSMNNVIGIASGTVMVMLESVNFMYYGDRVSVQHILTGMVSAIAAITGFAALPRHPDEFLHGRRIDRESCASVFELLTFSWSKILFKPAILQQCSVDELPVLSSPWRAGRLAEAHSANTKKSRYSYKIVLAKTHIWSLICLNALTVLKATAPLAPQAARYLVLQRLTSTTVGTDFRGIGLALSVGALTLGEIWVEAFLSWYTVSRVQVPVQATIMSLIYEKTLRIGGQALPGGNKAGAKKRQRADNLRIQSASVVMLYTDSAKLLRALAKLITTSIFLVKLMGWRGITAGVIVSWIPIPLVKFVARKDREIKFSLMEQRSQSATPFSDALLAIRQLKLTAKELTWCKRLAEYRQRELSLLSSSAWSMCALVFVANVSPEILTGIPIYIYAMQNKVMSAPVAFTCIDLFMQLQSELSVLPLYLTYQSDAWAGIKKLDAYFREPEVEECDIVPARDISLEGVHIEWYDSGNSEPFSLRSVMVVFPDGELTVVTGETGSGKTLLLASLAGEARIISGVISGPEKSGVDYREDLIDTDWIQPNHFAIVTQTPWIENNTIRDNILFGLPMNKKRYNEVLHCCALDTDLKAMTDGDATIVGPKGAALSGGQRCRMALARALYSRAGVLLLDDVLSAVDAEIREWLVKYALAGALSKGRTVILATHYGLQCEKRASRMIHLEGGTVKYQRDLHNAPHEKEESLSTEVIEETRKSNDQASSRHVKEESFRQKDREASAKETVKESSSTETRWYSHRAFYHASGGLSTWSLVTLACIVCELLGLGKSWWLNKWTAQNFEAAASSGSVRYYGGVYMAISIVGCLMTVVRCMGWYMVGRKASTALV